MAHHESGISPKYSENCSSLRSLEQKTTENFLPAALSFSYVAFSLGVNPLHGGHQWALKYRAMISDCARTSSTLILPERVSKSPLSASHSVGGFHVSGSSMMHERPSLLMISPCSSSRISAGMPFTLYFFDSFALASRSAYGSASHGIPAK